MHKARTRSQVRTQKADEYLKVTTEVDVPAEEDAVCNEFVQPFLGPLLGEHEHN